MKLLAYLIAPVLLFAQAGETPKSAPPSEQEQLELSKAISEAGSSGIDYVRALEHHLAKYPDTPRRLEIEKALAKSAMEANDRARILRYGEKVLQADPSNEEIELMDRVTRILLDGDDPESAKRALEYARRYGRAVEAMRLKVAESHMSQGQWSAEVDKAKARVLVLEARATGNIGNAEEAVSLARAAWDASPNPEAAREIARWLVKVNRKAEALTYYADAFVMDDTRTTEADRARDRQHLGETYRAINNGSEKGLGDLILEAYDKTAALKKERLASMKVKDPNVGATEILDYTLSGADGGAPIVLSSLKGKTVVLDFWATWCGPCKVQHPMIEKIRDRYRDNDKIAFLSVDTDADRTLVAPFAKEMKWKGRIYFDDGVGRMLNISSIPTVIVLDPNGKISSRMIGFIPERFEAMLTERIEETRAN